MKMLERAWAGKEPFINVMIGLVIIPYVGIFLINQMYALYHLKTVPILYHLYNIWIFATLVWMGTALLCLWKCSLEKGELMPNSGRLGAIVIAALFTFVLPVVSNLLLFDLNNIELGENKYVGIEKRMSAPFEGIDQNMNGGPETKADLLKEQADVDRYRKNLMFRNKFNELQDDRARQLKIDRLDQEESTKWHSTTEQLERRKQENGNTFGKTNLHPNQ